MPVILNSQTAAGAIDPEQNLGNDPGVGKSLSPRPEGESPQLSNCPRPQNCVLKGIPETVMTEFSTWVTLLLLGHQALAC